MGGLFIGLRILNLAASHVEKWKAMSAFAWT
jgi:hypothetical protein